VGAENQIFSPSELEENKQRKAQLFKLISSGDSILMVGAGSSASIYPDWSSFIKLLEDESKGIDVNFTPFDVNSEDFLCFADRAKVCLGESSYYHYIYNQYRPKLKTHERYHEILCSLYHNNKFKAITTTNYDIVLENALGSVTGNGVDNSIWIDDGIEPAKIFEFLLSLNYSQVTKRILHIHGKYDIKPSIILSESEYKAKYGFSITKPVKSLYQSVKEGLVSEEEFNSLLNQHGLVWTPHRKILWSLFATRRMVFIGFSMSDPYFQKMLDNVKEDLHTQEYSAHYLILRITLANKERVLAFSKNVKKKYGLETVFFEDDETFLGLERFIYEMENETKDIIENIKPKHNIKFKLRTAINDKDLTNELMKISREQNNAD
jgi:hypothetical protein